MVSEWNNFVKKIYHEGKKNNANYTFSQALKDASKRKSEMGTSNNTTKHNKSSKVLMKRKTKRNRSKSRSRKSRSRK